jgi:HK97 family phage prohead protease
VTPEAFKAAVEIHEHQRLCSHESAHAAAAMLLGLTVHGVDAPFWRLEDLEHGDDDDAAGVARIACRRDHDDDLRKYAIAVIAGRLEDGATAWPPKWPLTLAPDHGDEADLIDAVTDLGLDAKGYSDLIQDAFALAASRPYERLHVAISHWLETHGHADAGQLARIKHITEGAEVEHLTLKAVTTTTDQGTFQAVISTEAVDREKDIVSATGMVNALRKWNRPIPLAWNHSTSAEDIFGHIDPQTVQAVNGEVIADGQVHLDSNVGREAWRSFKARSIGFSFGYLILEASKRAGGGRHILELDVFEVTATPTPMNNNTRVLGTKALDTDDLDRVRNETRDHMLYLMSANTGTDTLRQKAQRIAREHAPITVATFDC